MNKKVVVLIRLLIIFGGSFILAGIIVSNVQKNNTEREYMSYVSSVENALRKYSETEVINGMVIPDITIERLVQWDYLSQYSDATVRIYDASYFVISKDIIGNVTIPDVKLVFTKNSESKTCTKNLCS